MTALVALSISIALLGGIATWLALGPLSGLVLIWTIFISWGAFFALGADKNAIKNIIVCALFGIICAWATALAILSIPLAETLTLPVWAGLAVAISALIFCLAAHLPLLSTIPATVFGYASTFAYILQTKGQLSIEALTTFNLSNSIIIIGLSIILGSLFGFASAHLGGILTIKNEQAS